MLRWRQQRIQCCGRAVLQPHTTSTKEIVNLLAIVDRDLADVSESISAD
jgi:hypothetical protein